MASDALAHRAGLVLSTGQRAVLSEHEYDLITGLCKEPDENGLTRGHDRQMDIQIVYTVTVSEEVRLEINRRTNKAGKATRAQVRQWYINHGCSLDSDLTKAAAAAGKHHDGHGVPMVDVAGTLNGLAVPTTALSGRQWAASAARDAAPAYERDLPASLTLSNRPTRPPPISVS